MAIKIKKRYKKREFPKELINERIRFPKVMVIDNEGKNLGTMETKKAQQLADNQKLDLVCINQGNADKLPLVKIIDYGKFKYERAKREKDSKRNQANVDNKEVRLTVNIGSHDMETKAKHAIDFLKDGNRLKVSVKFKGREMQHKELGFNTINKFYELISEYGVIEKEAKLNTRFLDMYLSPNKKTKNIATKETINKAKTEEKNNGKNEDKKSTI